MPLPALLPLAGRGKDLAAGGLYQHLTLTDTLEVINLELGEGLPSLPFLPFLLFLPFSPSFSFHESSRSFY